MAQLVPLLKPIDQRNEIVSKPSETIEIEYVSASALAVTPVMLSIFVVKGKPSGPIKIEYVSAPALAVTPVMLSILAVVVTNKTSAPAVTASICCSVTGSAAKAPDDMAASNKKPHAVENVNPIWVGSAAL